MKLGRTLHVCMTGVGALGALSTFASELPLPLEQLLSFLPQLTMLSLLMLIVACIRREPLIGAVALLAVIFSASALIPYVIPHSIVVAMGVRSERSHSQDDHDIGKRCTVVHANVLYGNKEGAKVVEYLNRVQPVVAFLVELDGGLKKALEPLHTLYPYRLPADGDEPHHIQLLSRVPFVDTEVRFLADQARPIVRATIEVDGVRLAVVAVHLAAPITFAKHRLRNEQLRELTAYLRTVPHPFVLLGDLNGVPWSPNIEQFVAAGQLSDGRRGRGLFPSWFLSDPKLWVLGAPIDHILASPEIRIENFERGPDIGSDHLPLAASIVFPIVPYGY